MSTNPCPYHLRSKTMTCHAEVYLCTTLCSFSLGEVKQQWRTVMSVTRHKRSMQPNNTDTVCKVHGVIGCTCHSPHLPRSAAAPSSSFSCLSSCHCTDQFSPQLLLPFHVGASRRSPVRLWWWSCPHQRRRSPNPSLSAAEQSGRRWWGR